MITKVSDIVLASEGLKEIADIDFNAATAMKIARIVRVIDQENAEFDKQRGKLFNKYGTQADDGAITVPKENVDVFVDELNELLDVEIELQVTKLSISDFGDVEVKPTTLAKIMFLITDDE